MGRWKGQRMATAMEEGRREQSEGVVIECRQNEYRTEGTKCQIQSLESLIGLTSFLFSMEEMGLITLSVRSFRPSSNITVPFFSLFQIHFFHQVTVVVPLENPFFRPSSHSLLFVRNQRTRNFKTSLENRGRRSSPQIQSSIGSHRSEIFSNRRRDYSISQTPGSSSLISKVSPQLLSFFCFPSGIPSPSSSSSISFDFSPSSSPPLSFPPSLSLELLSESSAEGPFSLASRLLMIERARLFC